MLKHFKQENVKSFDYDLTQGLQLEQISKSVYNDPLQWQTIGKHNVTLLLFFKGNLNNVSQIKIPQNPSVYK